MPKRSAQSAPPASAVRSRRAYFDCRYGQLHVRTAFPTTGGFDEQVTLLCLHPDSSSSRVFSRFLPLVAGDRSVYAPDMPGCGESDPCSAPGAGAAAAAIADLAAGLRLRHIDVLGFQGGSAVAVELAITLPELVRGLVLVGGSPGERLALIKQPGLVLRVGAEAAAAQRLAAGPLPHVQCVDVPEYAEDPFDTAPQSLAKRIVSYLNRLPSVR
jgi:pimeloyl-ACP methyl ester carboxylesterase